MRLIQKSFAMWRFPSADEALIDDLPQSLHANDMSTIRQCAFARGSLLSKNTLLVKIVEPLLSLCRWRQYGLTSDVLERCSVSFCQLARARRTDRKGEGAPGPASHPALSRTLRHANRGSVGIPSGSN
jgi:hypothetical protein